MSNKGKIKSKTAKKSGKESKGAKPATRSGQGFYTNHKGLTIGLASVIISIVVLGSVWWVLQSPITTPPDTTTPPTTADFSITVIDGITGGERNLTAWNLYNTTDVEGAFAAPTWDSMKTGSAEELLTVTAINEIIDWSDGTEESYWLSATAANNVSAVHDWCAYLTAWIELDLTGANVLAFYATPNSDIGMTFYNNGTEFTAKNFTAATEYEEVAGLSEGWSYDVGNFSLIVGINATDIGFCGYHGIYDPQATEGPAQTGVYLVFNFNATVTNAELFIKNQVGGLNIFVQVEKLNNTALAFYAPNMVDTCILNMQWKQDQANNIKVTSVETIYGSWGEAAAHSGTSLEAII